MIPTVVDYLTTQWGSPVVSLPDPTPYGTKMRQSWVWFPQKGGHSGNHVFHVDHLRDYWMVEASGGRCCPSATVSLTFRNEPDDYRLSALVGLAFGLYDDVIHHHMNEMLRRAVDSVKREVHREARYQTELSGRGSLSRTHEPQVHAYVAERFAEVEGAIGHMLDHDPNEKIKMTLITAAPGVTLPGNLIEGETQDGPFASGDKMAFTLTEVIDDGLPPEKEPSDGG